MRRCFIAPALLLLLSACVKDVSEVDDSPPEETGTPDDTQEELEDQDQDGFNVEQDCDDDNAAVHPDATELCDGIDNNCDGVVDEGFDADQDGELSALECETGTDCDDTDASVYSAATEVPYDGLDQDCDGVDLVDVDGDGFDAVEAGGNDCDDADTAINPGAEDTPKDGIDQDCDGLDSIDGDGDGYDDEALGGDDCDDSNASVNPGAPDYKVDGVDADCSGKDGERFALADSDAIIEGDAGLQNLTGRSVAVCDLDEDGLDDLVVGEPFGDSYSGRVAVFYGSGSSAWTSGMSMASADTLITGATNGFIGFEASCADLDGDGHQDVFFQRGEIDYASTYVQQFGLLIFYGDGGGFEATLDGSDADAELTLELGVVAEEATVVNSTMSWGDSNGDGAMDVILTVGSTSLSTFDYEERVVILPGAAYSGDSDMTDHLSHIIAPGQPSQLSWAGTTSDLDGDGSPDLVILSNLFTSDLGDTGDTGDTGYELEGRLDYVGALPGASTSLSLDDISDGGYVGASQSLFGQGMAEGDFDGDGIQDLIISSLGADEAGTANTGGLFFFSNAGADMAGVILDASAEADAVNYGDRASGYLGWELKNAGDVDGDGMDDLLVSKPDVATGYIGKGDVFLVPGSVVSASSPVEWEDNAYMHWRGPNTEDATGDALALGDFDGDGEPDLVVGEYGYSSGQGRVYIHMSGSW